MAGFGFPTEFSASRLPNEKVDPGRDPYTVLGTSYSSVADHTLDASDHEYDQHGGCAYQAALIVSIGKFTDDVSYGTPEQISRGSCNKRLNEEVIADRVLRQ